MNKERIADVFLIIITNTIEGNSDLTDGSNL